MKKLIAYAISFSIALLSIHSAAAQQRSMKTLSYEKVLSWLADAQVPAAGIGIIEDGTIKDVRVIGNLTRGTSAPATTVFNVASLTKPVFAVTVLKLIDNGNLSLDEPLSSYWIDPDIKNDLRHKKLTPRLVLSHQTGFPNWRWDNGGRQLAFQFEPGEKFGYSGEGYEYLRKAVERKMKASIAQLSTAYLFNAVSMNNTGYTWNESLSPKFALWHDKNGKQSYPIRKTTDACAADDLLTTVGDYTTFGVHVLHRAGLTPATYNEMIKPHVNVSEHVGQGLGWLIVKDLPNDEFALVHSGADVGVRTIIILLPRSHRGLVILTNGDRGNEVIVKIVNDCLDIAPQLVSYLQQQ
jgi:CubicO group peptidase (beta-lactamase class C family)